MKNHKIIIVVLPVLFLLSLRSLASTIYVKQGGTGSGTSWSNAYGSLQNALTNASQGDEIWIAEGTYTPTNNTSDRWARFEMKPGLKLYGGFNGTETTRNQRDSLLVTKKTILSGEIQNDGIDTNNTICIVRIKDIAIPVYLNSLIIEKTYSSGNIVTNSGAINIGGSVAYLSNIELRNIWGNWAGAVSIHQSKVYINNANINNNESILFGGGIMIDYSTELRDRMYIEIKNSTLNRNTGDIGGALYSKLNTGDSLILDGCKIINNTGGDIGGGGLFMEGEGGFVSLNKMEIRSNTVTGIWNGGGGIFMVYGSLIAHDVLIADNTIAGEEGGGIFLQALDNARFVNCTFANNEAGNYPGNQVYIVASNAIEFKNCIIDSVGKGLPDFAPWAGWEYTPNVTFTNCLLGGSLPDFWIDGGGNITNTNPRFISSSNYALSDSSQAIDAGNNTFRLVSYTDDLARNTRIYNGIVDIGAYEFIPKEDSVTSINGTSIASEIEVYPNPTSESIIIEGAAKGSWFVLYNILGQSVFQNKIHADKQSVDISLLHPGTYLIRIQHKNGRQSSVKFIKQ